MTIPHLAWVDCTRPGCEAGLVIDFRLSAKFEGRDWRCNDHQERTK